MKYFQLLFFIIILSVYAEINIPPSIFLKLPVTPKIMEDLSNNTKNVVKNLNIINISDNSLDVKHINDTIVYGLDSQVINIIKNLKKSDDDRYNIHLQKRLEKTFSTDLKKEILELFTSVKYSGGVKTANYILENYESKRYPNDLISSAILYLKEFGDKNQLKKILVDIIENKKGNIVSIAVYYLGELGSLEYSKNLMDIYEKYSVNDGTKKAILIAIGKSKATEYQDKIFDISLDNYENPIIRAAAIEALSYLAPEKVTENADIYFQNNNDNIHIKSAIIASLSKDSSLKSKEILQDFLRDSNDNIRLKAVNAIGIHNDISSKNILIYKIRSDPSFKVREVSVKTLVDINSELSEIKDIMFDTKIDNNFKTTMFRYLLDKDPLRANSIALELVNKENIHNPSDVLISIATMLAIKKGDFDKFYSKIIDSKDIDLMHLALKGAVYNKSLTLLSRLKNMKKTTNSEYIKILLKDY